MTRLNRVDVVGRLSRNGGGKKPAPIVTTCKLCRCGIRAGDDPVWLSKPTGLVHPECAQDAAERGEDIR